MSQSSLPVDLFNPGQVFACLGFLEAADQLLGDAEGGFEWADDHGHGGNFKLRVAGACDPLATVLAFLSKATVTSLAPENSANRTEKWKIPTRVLGRGEPFPFPDPSSPATLPALLEADGKSIVLDHWGEATKRDNVKFWAGSGGYPGAALAADALDLVRGQLQSAQTDPLALAAPQSSSFRFDWRRDYIPIETGFSPNEHGDVKMIGFPVVEIMAAIGLAHARPFRIKKLEYLYAAISTGRNETLLPPSLIRAALGCTPLPFPTRTFRMRLGWPGQENQARCILDVTEEPRS